MITLLKFSQLAVAVAVNGLVWLIYPGAMAVFASIIGLAYLVAAVGAMRDHRLAVWISFVFSIITAILSTLGVSRFVRNDFDFLAGNFAQQSGIYFPPYLMLAVSIGALLVVAAHLLSWRWLLRA